MFDLPPPRHISTLRNPVVPASSGEGPLTIRFADLRHRAFANGRLLSYGLCPGKPPKGKLDGGEGHEGDQGFDEVLEVLGQTPVSSEPGAGVQATDVVLSYGDNQITNGQQLL